MAASEILQWIVWAVFAVLEIAFIFRLLDKIRTSQRYLSQLIVIIVFLFALTSTIILPISKFYLLLLAVIWFLTEMAFSKRPDVNARDGSGETLLMMAAERNDLGALQALLGKGADVNLKNSRGSTALMMASSSGIKIVEALLDAGAEVNAQDDEGNTALMFAAFVEDCEVLRVLLVKGADIDIRDKNGLTALAGAKPGGAAAALLRRAEFIMARDGRITDRTLGTPVPTTC